MNPFSFFCVGRIALSQSGLANTVILNTLFLLFCSLLPCGFTACSKEKMDEMVSSVKQQAQTVTEQAKAIAASPALAEIVPATGRSEVQLPTPLSTNAAYFRLYSFEDGRPGVVQFTSYDPEKGPNAYPALLVRANTVATSVSAVAGQTLMGRVFLQAASGSPVLMTPEGALVDVDIAPLNPEIKTINASIGSVTLYDAKGQASTASGIIVEGVQP